MQRVIKPEYVEELGDVDISLLEKMIHKISPKLWEREDISKENNFFCFHNTQHIIFRFIPGNQSPKDAYSNQIWQPWQGILLPILQSVAQKYPYEQVSFPKVILAKLQPNSIIDRHIDAQKSNIYTHKIHIPIQTNPKALFVVKDKSFHLQKGYAYEVNNIVTHGVENNGEQPRIHLIFEIFNSLQ